MKSQALLQWTEVVGHPGLICTMTQTSNTPIVLMIKPDAILVQEIKIQPTKAKVLSFFFFSSSLILFEQIQDMVAIRHSSSQSEQKTTLILLCEDGSLRIYMTNHEVAQ